MPVVHLLGQPAGVWSVGGLVWETCGKTVGFSTELPHVREAKSTDCPHGIRPPGNTYLPTDFSEEPEKRRALLTLLAIAEEIDNEEIMESIEKLSGYVRKSKG